jgi:hypothetical protein
MTAAPRQDTLAAPLYPARADDPDRLYELLPADLRRRDLLAGAVLQSLLRILGSQYTLLESDIGQLYDDLSVETCRPELLPYIGDLLGFKLPRTASGVEAGGPAAEALEESQASLLRRLIGGLVASRRRKGCIAEARLLARTFGHASSYLVETAHRIDRSPPVRRPPGLGLVPADFAPSVRGRCGPPPPDSPYAHFPLTADVRRVLSEPGVTPGRAHPDGLEVHLGRLNSYPIVRASAHVVEHDDDPYLYLGTFDPTGASVPLLRRALDAPGRGEAVGESHFVAPIRRRAMAARLLDYYGEDKSVAVWVDGGLMTAWQVRVADLRDAAEPGGGRPFRWAVPRAGLASGRLLIDPERGRLALRLPGPKAQPPGHKKKAREKDPEAPTVRVSYYAGLLAPLGGGGYPRTLRAVDFTKDDPDEEWSIVVDPAAPDPPPTQLAPGVDNRVRTLDEAVSLFETTAAAEPYARVVIELAASSTFPWRPDEVHIPAGARLTLRAAPGAWPLVLAGGHPDRAERVKFVGDEPADGGGPGLPARLVLDGLRIAGRALHLEDNLRAVIRDTTLVPGWVPAGAAEGHHPGAASLSLHGVRAGVVLDRCVLGRIQVLPKELDDPTPLVLRDSVVDAGVPHGFALAGRDRYLAETYHHADGDDVPHAYVALLLRRTTVFGRVRVFQVVLAEDSLLDGRCDVARRQAGCLRFCYVPADSDTPPRYRCQPDLALADLRQQMADATQPTDPDSAEGQARLALRARQVRPAFASRRYGDPYYAALHSAVAPEVRTGAEDGGEFGAFHDLGLPARDQELLDRLAEGVPAATDVRLIIHPETVS